MQNTRKGWTRDQNTDSYEEISFLGKIYRFYQYQNEVFKNSDFCYTYAPFTCADLHTVCKLYIIQLFHCFEGNIPECLSRGSRESPRCYISQRRRTNVLVYFPRSNEITVMLHFTRENA